MTPAESLAWARAELIRRADDAWLMPTPAEIAAGRDPVRRARSIRRRRVGLSRADAARWLELAARESARAA